MSPTESHLSLRPQTSAEHWSSRCYVIGINTFLFLLFLFVDIPVGNITIRVAIWIAVLSGVSIPDAIAVTIGNPIAVSIGNIFRVTTNNPIGYVAIGDIPVCIFIPGCSYERLGIFAPG